MNASFSYKVRSDDFLNMGHVSNDVRKNLNKMNIDHEVIRRVSTALYQGEINMLIHAGGGTIDVEITDKCITMTLEDKGPGIENIAEALTDGFSTANKKARSMGFGQGTGLTAMKQFSDEMQLYSEPGVGTTLIMKVFLTDDWKVDNYANEDAEENTEN